MKRLLFLFSYGWGISKRLFFITAVRSCFEALLPLVNIAGLGMVINALTLKEPEGNVVSLIIIFLSVNLGIEIIREIFTLLHNNIVRSVSNVMQYQYMQDSLNIDYHYVQDRSILDLKKKSVFVNPSVFLDYVGTFLKHIVSFAGIISVFSLLSPYFLLILAATSAVSIILTFRSRKNDFEYQNDMAADDRKLDQLYKIMTGYKHAKEIRLNRADRFIGEKYNGLLGHQIGKLKSKYAKSMRYSLLGTITTVIQSGIMYFYFSYQVFSGQVSIAQYTVLLGTTTLFTSILLDFFDNIAQIDKICKRVDFFREYRELTEKHSTISKSNTLEEKSIDFSNVVFKFENVSFAYPETREPVLKNINIEIKKGEKIGIVGLNGSGKTTLIKLLTRIYDPDDGRITVNGTDIREIPYRQYADHIGIVLQDYLLFAYSVRDNIVLDRPCDDSRLRESIEKSGLKSKIDSLPDGADTVVYKELDDNGIEFSGGEGQKLALARAVYKNADLLILDEPTSALDPIAEYEFFSRLVDIAGDKTTVFISHRLSSTRFCDKIHVLEDGEIRESGNHQELMALGGSYAALFSTQARYYEAAGKAVPGGEGVLHR